MIRKTPPTLARFRCTRLAPITSRHRSGGSTAIATRRPSACSGVGSHRVLAYGCVKRSRIRNSALVICTDSHCRLSRLCSGDFRWWDTDRNELLESKDPLGTGQAQLSAPIPVSPFQPRPVAAYALLLVAPARRHQSDHQVARSQWRRARLHTSILKQPVLRDLGTRRVEFSRSFNAARLQQQRRKRP